MTTLSTKKIDLKEKAKEIRKAIFKTICKGGGGHIPASLSITEILTVLYYQVMNIDPKNPKDPQRDRFILSKGHSAIGLFTILYLKGFISHRKLLTFRQNGSDLGGHLDLHKVPGVEMSTGSLGHGLSVGVGIALAGKIDQKNYRVFVLMGDGETQEGSIWEAAMSAAHYKLDNLIGIIDRNKIQIDGYTEDIMSLEPYKDKWESFGWSVQEINGHDMNEILQTLDKTPNEKGKPSLIICHTIKGKGITFMENSAKWHGGAPSGDLAARALEEMKPFSKSEGLL